MADFQASKALVLAFHDALDKATAESTADAMARFAADGYRWRGMHPFNELGGVEATAREFWQPFKLAFRRNQRRPQIFFAGRNTVAEDGAEWVCSMGNLLSLFDAPWLGIPPTGKMNLLRYAEFNRVAGGKVEETVMFFDILGVMHQAGLRFVPESTGATVIDPGPRTQDGLLLGPHPEQEGQETMNLINRMIDTLVSAGIRTTLDDLKKDWHDDMLWWGPAGIGAAYTHERYLAQHARPFEDGLELCAVHGHELEFAEGNYGGFYGWPSISMRPTGGYMGLTTACDRAGDMRIVDLYRREGDKLAENWIFIDNLHFLKSLGFDLLDRVANHF